MQYNGSTGPMHPPDHTSMLLEQLFESQRDQTQELRKQSNALGWIMSQLSTGRTVHTELKGESRELKQDVQALKSDVAQLKAASAPKQQPVKFNVIADSIAGVLHAGRPYLVCCVLVAGKLLGLGPSWIEPLIEKLAKALLS